MTLEHNALFSKIKYFVLAATAEKNIFGHFSKKGLAVKSVV